MVTQGLSDTGLSADRGRSTSAGAALVTSHLPLHSLPPVTNPVNYPDYQLPDYQLRADESRGTAALETAVLGDHYEITMLQASLRSGAANRRAIVEVVAGRLPHG